MCVRVIPYNCLALKNRRETRGQQSLHRSPPTSEEAARLHEMYLRYAEGVPCNDGFTPVSLGDTLLENTMQMYPQQRK
jgi:acyl-coenzyme A thioesterase 9